MRCDNINAILLSIYKITESLADKGQFFKLFFEEFQVLFRKVVTYSFSLEIQRLRVAIEYLYSNIVVFRSMDLNYLQNIRARTYRVPTLISTYYVCDTLFVFLFISSGGRAAVRVLSAVFWLLFILSTDNKILITPPD